MNWWRSPAGGFHRLFRQLAPDVVGLLVAQGDVSVAAMAAFADWSSNGPTTAATVVDLEHRADAARSAVLTALRGALATPIDQEDLYILSERCDRVVNAVRDIVLDAEALAWRPDEHAAAMAADLHRAVTALVDGFGRLRRDPGAAVSAADRTRAHTRAVFHRYREALPAVVDGSELRPTLAALELLRAYLGTATLVEAAADRLWYVVLAES